MLDFPPLASIALVAVVAFSAGGVTAWRVQNWRHDAKKVAEMQELNRLNAKRETVSAQAGTLYAEKQKATNAKVIERIVQVDRFVPATSCPLSGGFRVYHDAAAEDKELPDPTAKSDAPAVTAKEVAVTTATNYGICHDNADRLEALQNWVNQQLKLNDADKSP